jgi:uncharacterized protein (DUF305 family)
MPAPRRITAVVLIVLALGACDRGFPSDSASFATGSTPSGARPAAQDAKFLMAMLPHHQHGVDLAALALDPAREASPRVVLLADDISRQQTMEMGLMQQWVREWGAPAPTASPARVSPGLLQVSGEQFDQAWLVAMSAHHDQAIAMARQIQLQSSNEQILDVANAIVANQSAQLGVMQGMRVPG